VSRAKIGITLDSNALKSIDAIATTKGAARSVIIEIAVSNSWSDTNDSNNDY